MSSEPIAYVCIACPVGCHLELSLHADGAATVTGNKCERGEVYAREEHFHPKRVVTATCAVDPPQAMRAPVKTDAPLAKEHIPELLRQLYGLTIPLPTRRGDVVLRDVLGSGVNVVVTRSIELRT